MDPEKRCTFDTLGSKSVQYIYNPDSIKWGKEFVTFSAHMKKAAWWKWIKFLLVVLFSAIALLQPILICVNINKTVALNGLGNIAEDPYWPWVVVLIPLWIVDFLLLLRCGLLYCAEFGSCDKYYYDSIGDEVDYPTISPRQRKYQTKHIPWPRYSFPAFYLTMGDLRNQYLFLRTIQLLLIILVEILIALKMDQTIEFNYSIVLIPLYLQQFLELVELMHSVICAHFDIKKMVTVRYLENEILKRPYAELTVAEKRKIEEEYIIVNSSLVSSVRPQHGNQQQGVRSTNDGSVEESVEYQTAQRIAMESRDRIMAFPPRVVFLVLLLLQLDNPSFSWSWWMVFIPVWIFIGCSCLFEAKNCSDCTDVKVSQGTVTGTGKNVENSLCDNARPETSLPTEADREITSPQLHKGSQESINLATNAKDARADDLDDVELGDTYADPLTNGSSIAGAGNHCNEECAGVTIKAPRIQLDVGYWAYLVGLLIMACLFVGKLQGGSYSALWIMFPIFLTVSWPVLSLEKEKKDEFLTNVLLDANIFLICHIIIWIHVK